ncbi:hypothetical protein IPV08_24045 [Methylobacterium sp. SD274]|uniref:hypothetical protein n=1 Tax=Methylobacterium sp. SD274 TaxID=2782009 RepID=UPI001A969212|nr:hypothetical protein [Methylobacterium sp. SD274]MBO1023029.1 hypothetical protein [Methylobacterium sp. SD274]
MTDTAQHARFLALAVENTELCAQLADAQEQCIELAVDAGELQAQIEALRRELVEVRAERDAWQSRYEWATRAA